MMETEGHQFKFLSLAHDADLVVPTENDRLYKINKDALQCVFIFIITLYNMYNNFRFFEISL